MRSTVTVAARTAAGKINASGSIASRDELKKESRELMREIRQAKKEKEEEERRKTMLQEEAEAREKEEGPLADFRRERNALISQAKSHKSEGREDVSGRRLANSFRGPVIVYTVHNLL